MPRLRVWILATATILTGCGTNSATTELIERSWALCVHNDGLRRIDNVSLLQESESCGFKCARATGFVVNDGDVRCKNGATFSTSVRIFDPSTKQN